MDGKSLLDRLIAAGADSEGILDRFGDNYELYERCFRDFMADGNFDGLRRALEAGQCRAAFEAAHALKGVSANLGLTDFYAAVCPLVESLRPGEIGAEAPEQYRELLRRYAALQRQASGEPEPMERLEALNEPKPDRKAARRYDNTLSSMIFAMFLALLLIGLLFCRMNINFRDYVKRESGRHLMEMAEQIRLYVEERIATDRRVALSVGDSVIGAESSDGAILEVLRAKRAVWGVSDLLIYTEDGDCTCADGLIEDSAATLAAIGGALDAGRSMAVADSNILYTVPLATELEFGGSRVTALSVVQDMRSFLDDMGLSSFGGKASVYLTEQSGLIISALSGPSAAQAENFHTLIDNRELQPLDGSSGGLFDSPETQVYIIDGSDGGDYIVSAQVKTGDEPLRLIYLAPEESVNSAMRGFSRQLTGFSLVLIAFITTGYLIFFYYAYKSRKRRYDSELYAREQLYDLLVKNTRNVFALYRAGETEPSYVSSNAPALLGDAYWLLCHEDGVFSVHSPTGIDSAAIVRVNETLRSWDGASEFTSGYIRSGERSSEYKLYPIEGGREGYIGVAGDVTDACRREDATRAALEMANRANEAKSSFLSNMSHDIRTPMNAIMNMSGFALESLDRPKQLADYLRTIQSSSEHLLRLINDVLDMSRIESGQTVVSAEPFDLLREIERQADMIRPLCQAKEQTFLVNLDGLTTRMVRGDALKLSQILANLLSNAVKFTPERGAVRLTARDIPSLREDMADIRISVEDNGLGISEENLEKIFKPFARADDRRIAGIEGTGLGLSICKSYVEAMGGVIRCESEEGEGSIFTVEIFFHRASEPAERQPAESGDGDAPFLGLRCLVAEDNHTNRLIAKTLLERVGFIADFAEDGAQCLELFRASRPGTYDLIYMDIQMPGLDGYEATAAIRESGHPQAATIPIVAMTANVFAEDVEKARTAGMDAYIGKPIVSFDLVEETKKALKRKKAQWG